MMAGIETASLLYEKRGYPTTEEMTEVALSDECALNPASTSLPLPVLIVGQRQRV